MYYHSDDKLNMIILLVMYNSNIPTVRCCFCVLLYCTIYQYINNTSILHSKQSVTYIRGFISSWSFSLCGSYQFSFIVTTVSGFTVRFIFNVFIRLVIANNITNNSLKIKIHYSTVLYRYGSSNINWTFYKTVTTLIVLIASLKVPVHLILCIMSIQVLNLFISNIDNKPGIKHAYLIFF